MISVLGGHQPAKPMAGWLVLVLLTVERVVFGALWTFQKPLCGVTSFRDELKARKLFAEPVPKPLTDEQKADRVSIGTEGTRRSRLIRDNIVIGDETWTFEYDFKRQTMGRYASACPGPKEKARTSNFKVKTMFIVFFFTRTVCDPQTVFTSTTDRQLRGRSGKTKEKDRPHANGRRRYLAATSRQCAQITGFCASVNFRPSNNMATLPQSSYSSGRLFLFFEVKIALK